jgi:hypothetical protein
MAGKSGRIGPQEQRFLELLLSGNSVAEAGRQLGIAERTAYRWNVDPELKAALKEMEGEKLSRAIRMLSVVAGKAVATLAANMQADVPAAVQVRAALGILDQVVKLKTALELEERVAQLEQMLVGKEGNT